jgi:branched-chain amino acid transport system substrate-binding protein
MSSLRKKLVVAAGVIAVLLAILASGSSAKTVTATAASSSPFGTVHKATKSPYVFGLINDETGAVTFPEARQAEIAAAAYANEYLDGINGHPIKLVDCIGDGTAPTSARCASELLAKHPVAILGAADTGTPAAETVYERAGLAYLGGVPFTPVEQNASNSVQFWSISLGDNAAASVYAAKNLHAKIVSELYFDNSQGKLAGLGIIPPVLKAAGVTTVKAVGVPPTTPDPSAEVAEALSVHPQVVYVDIPNNCGVVLKDLKSLGYSGKIIGIDPCTSPQAITSSAGAAQGMIDATPFTIGSSQYKLFLAALDLGCWLRDRAERPKGAQHCHWLADHQEDPGSVQDRVQPPELHVPSLHLQWQGDCQGGLDLQQRLPDGPCHRRQAGRLEHN